MFTGIRTTRLLQSKKPPNKHTYMWGLSGLSVQSSTYLHHMTHLRAHHQLRDTMHHGDCCCGDGSLLVPICALEPEKEKQSGRHTFFASLRSLNILRWGKKELWKACRSETAPLDSSYVCSEHRIHLTYKVMVSISSYFRNMLTWHPKVTPAEAILCHITLSSTVIPSKKEPDFYLTIITTAAAATIIVKHRLCGSM